MKHSRTFIWLLVSLFGLTLAVNVAPAATASAGQSGMDAAWERAREAGSYRFSADINQVRVPKASVTNVGRQSREQNLHIEGETDLPGSLLDFTLWSEGGSILDAQSGVEVRVEGDRALARQGGGAWEEINDFSGLFAPDGDFMAYMAAAKDVTDAGTETRGGVTFTKYAFDIDGPRFAAYMRDQTEEYLATHGELPPGAELDAPKVYSGMSGEGELWVGLNGLPLREILHLDLPETSDDRLLADVSVSFSSFGNPPAETALQELRRTLFPQRLLQQAALFSTAVACIAILVAYRESRKLYAAIVLAIISSMLLTPVLQSVQAAGFAERQQAKAQEQERRAEQSEMLQSLRSLEAEGEIPSAASPEALRLIESDNGLDSDRDGATDVEEMLLGSDPLAAEAVQADDPVWPPVDRPEAKDDGTDSDGDGLTDYVEKLIGTDPEADDSDNDLLDDKQELEGFDYLGRHWHTDPLEADTSGDGKGDGAQYDVNNDGQVDDTDGDEIPDIFDFDNDGDGVPDKLDLSPYETTTPTLMFGEDQPFSLVVNGLTKDSPTYVEFQLRPTNPDHLWYAYNVLNWPDGDKQGQIQDGDGATLFDKYPDDARSPNENGDVKLVPMLEMVISGSPTNLPPQSELSNYGISVVDLEEGGAEKAVYVPLQLVTDDQGDARVAFYGKMLYRPADWWGAEQKVRLVWVVSALVDECTEYGDGECSAFGSYNNEQPIYLYPDEWYLTGLNVREDGGVKAGFVYEDPERDADKNDDSELMKLAFALDSTFLAGRGVVDPVQDVTVRDITVEEIYRRLDHTANPGVPASERWSIEDWMSVITRTYKHQDQALMTIAMTETKQILEDTFTAHIPVSPTIMILREERARGLNLDETYAGNPLLQWDGRQLLVNLDNDEVKFQTTACMNWAPYRYDYESEEANKWTSYMIEDYWEEIARRYEDDFSGPDPDASLGALTVAQLMYLVIYKGVFNVVQIGDAVLERDPMEDDQLGSYIFGGTKAAGAVIKFVVNKWIMRGIDKAFQAQTALGKLVQQQRFSKSGLTQPTGLVSRLLKQFKGWWKGASNLARGVVAVTAIVVIAGLAVGVYFLARAYMADNIGAKIAIATIVGIAMFALTVVVPILKVADLVKAAQQLYNIGKMAALGKVLTSSGEMAGQSSKAGIVGMVIAIAITWGVFIYAVATSDIPPGSVAFNQLLAQAIAGTIVAIIMFVISQSVVGTIILALIALVDIILLILGVDFSITGFVTEMIAKALYHFELMVGTDMSMGAFDTQLVNQEDGIVDGNQMYISTAITTTAVHSNPTDIRLIPYLPIHYTKNSIRRTTFDYQLDAITETVTVSANDDYSDWTVTNHHKYLAHQMYQGVMYEYPEMLTTLEAGINSVVDMYLNTGYSIPGIECWTILVPCPVCLFPPVPGFAPTPVCYKKDIDGNSTMDMTGTIILDVLPRTLDEFYELAWGGPDFIHQKDHDGDGLINLYFSGNDPDDEEWDTDNDGLSDAYELQMSERGWDNGGAHYSAGDPDTDNDYLTDAQEVRFGTDPDRPDSDGDLLDDSQEVYHQDSLDMDDDGDTKEWLGGWSWTHVYTDANGAQVTVSYPVTSDPLASDPDGDGMSDLAEKTLDEMAPEDYPFHPNVWNESPIAFYVDLSDEDAIVKPNDSLVYTATVENNLVIPLYAMGVLTTAIPTELVLGSARVVTSSFNVYREEAASLTTTLSVDATSNSTVTIDSAMFANLHDGDTRIKFRWYPTHKRSSKVPVEYPWYSAMAPLVDPAEQWAYAVATVEGNKKTSSFSSRYVEQTSQEYPVGTGVRLRPATEAFGQGSVVSGPADTRWRGPGPVKTPPDVACDNNGKCMTVMADSQYATCTTADTFRLYCHEEKDGNGSHAEFYLKFNGDRLNESTSTATGEWEYFNFWLSFCEGDTLELWEDDPDTWPQEDDKCGSTESLVATIPGDHSRRFTDGDATVYWYVDPHFEDYVRAAVTNANGELLCGSAVGRDVENYKVTPVVASNGASFVTVWKRLENIQGLFAKKVNVDCTYSGPDEGTLVNGTSRDSSSPDLAAVGANRYLLVWTEEEASGSFGYDYDIRMIYLDQNGAAQGGTLQTLAGSGLQETAPSAAYNPDTGEALVVYRYRNPYGVDSIKGRFATASGLGKEIVVAEKLTGNTLGNPDVAFAPNIAYGPMQGGWMVAWDETNASGQVNIRYMPLSAEGDGLLDADADVDAALMGVTSTPLPNGLSKHDTACRIDRIGKDIGECATIVNPRLPTTSDSSPLAITLEQMSLRRVLPWLGRFDFSDGKQVVIDAEAPSASFTSLRDGQYITATDALVIGGDAGDNTHIAYVEVGVDDSWSIAEGAEAWAYTWEGLTSGRHKLQVKAWDVAGNEGAVETIYVYVDTRPPVPTTDTPDPSGTEILQSVRDDQGQWVVHASGGVSDPSVGGYDGSGIRSLEALVGPNGNGWQTATLTMTTGTAGGWGIDYALPPFDAEGAALVNPTGWYTLSVRATDGVSNTTQPGGYLRVPFGIDTTPPVADVRYTGPYTSVITSTLYLTGTATDPRAAASGVDALEIFVGLAGEELVEWTPIDNLLGASGDAERIWSHQVPANLEGTYRVDLRGTDVLGNRNDNMSTWQQWHGEIDTRAPTATITMTYRGNGAAAQTIYEGFAEDLNLSEKGFVFPCKVQAKDRTYFSSPWWDDVSSDPTRLHRLTPSCIQNGFHEPAPSITACDIYSHCYTIGAVLPSATPPIASVVLTPSHESVLTNVFPISVTVGAHADDGLRSVTLWEDTTPIGAIAFSTNTVTDTLWYTATWNPSAEGVYTLMSRATDWDWDVQTETQPISVTVDWTRPTVTISPTVLTSTHRLAFARVGLGGAATDTIGLESVRVTSNTVHWGDAAFGGGVWRYPWYLCDEADPSDCDEPDGEQYSVTVRADDGGWTAEATEVVTVDLTLPHESQVTLSYTEQGGGGPHALEPGQTIRQSNPTLEIDWTASSDGSGLDDYLVGWTHSPAEDAAALTAYAPSATLHHEVVAGEAEVWYAHVVARDLLGNKRWETVGPIYVDAATTPDFVADLGYHGWMESGCTQIGADYEIARNAFSGASLTGTQHLYASWHTDTLRFTWTGANWDTDGDLFIYLDTAAGGTSSALDPSGSGQAIGLPSEGGQDLLADYLVWVKTSAEAELWAWGSGWLKVRELGDAEYQFDTTLDPAHTDILVPFDDIGDPANNGVRAVALGSDDGALRIWAAIPDKNPVNSPRVVNPVAVPYADQDFDLLHQHEWAGGLRSGMCPNEGKFVHADLLLELTAEPLGVEVGFLELDVPSLLGPGTWLDGADRNGQPDQNLPIDMQSVLVGNEQVITYTLNYSNEGREASAGLTVTVDLYGTLELPGGGSQLSMELGSVPAGHGGTETFTATVRAVNPDQSAEVKATAEDGVHGPFDWLWVLHEVDTFPPDELVIERPVAYVGAFTNTIRGGVSDPSGVPTITLQVQSVQTPTTVNTVDCIDGTPFDGEWECSWDFSGSKNGDDYYIRAKGTDRWGNANPGWDDVVEVEVDTILPEIGLDEVTTSALLNVLITPDELMVGGVVTDAQQAVAAYVCGAEKDEPLSTAACKRVPVEPGDAVTGTWRTRMPVVGTGDGSWQTVYFYGADAAGNHSASLDRDVLVDIVGPVVTPTVQETGAVQYAPPFEVFAGELSDGWGLDRLVLHVEPPGATYAKLTEWYTYTFSGHPATATWSLVRDFGTLGWYAIGGDAYDRADNRTPLQSFKVLVLEGDNVADLRLSQVGSSDPSVTSRPFTYTVTVENKPIPGTSDATSTILNVWLPEQGVYQSAIPTNGGSCTEASGVLTCTLGTVLNGTSVDVPVVVDVPLTTTGKLSFSALVDSSKVDFHEEDNEVVFHVDTFQPVTGLEATSDQPTVLGEVTTFTATIETGTDVGYRWAFGDGMTSTGKVVSYTYPAVGRYTAVVTAGNWVNEISATTPVSVDIPIATPFVDEGFEDTFPPEGWQVHLLESSSDDQGWETSRSIRHRGATSALHSDLFGMYDSWLVAPQVTPTIGSELVFWNFARYEQDYFKRGIWVSTSRGDPKYYEFDPVQSVGPDTETTWEEMRVDLADYVGEPIYLAFHYEGDFADQWYVDDVQVTAPLVAMNDGPTRFGEPTTVSATVGTGTNVAYTWDFGDGDAGAGQVVTHTYGAPGVFTAIVTARNSVSTVTATTRVGVGVFSFLPMIVNGYVAPCFDDYEPDDVSGQAKAIATDGTAQLHNFHDQNEVDWVRFEVLDPSVDFVIETLDLVGGADTVVYLFDRDETTLLDWNDDAGPRTLASRLVFNPYQSGTYYLKIVPYYRPAAGCDMGYSVRVTAQP